MSDGTYTRSLRPFEPRVPESRAADQPTMDRRGETPDPLQELARLIGRSDPFAPAQRGDQPRGNERDSSEAPRAPPVWGRDYPRVQGGPGHQDRYADQEYADDDRHAVRTPPPRFPIASDHPDPAAMPPEGSGFYRHPDQFEHPLAPAPAYAEPVDPHAYADPQAGHYDKAFGGHEEYAGEYAETNEEEYEYESDLEEEPPEDDGASLKRRHTTKVVLAVLGLAVFGSAAAFGFRTILKGGVQGPPPIIRADNSPTKTIPAGSPGDTGAKPINERLGGAASERVERREEEPVQLGRTAGGVMPGTGGPFDAVGGLPPATSAPATTAPASAVEPKRVRTVHIPAGEGGVAPPAVPPPPARASAPQRPAASQSAASSGAPLAITPQASANAEPPPTRSASRSAPAASPATDSGGFVVQLSAQKSEAEAQVSMRAMQSRYAAVLNGQHPLIRRKDLGDRGGGVVYAAQVGPYGTRDEANQVCESFKSAGGTCFVQKN
jgi:cell division septation protein DedD